MERTKMTRNGKHDGEAYYRQIEKSLKKFPDTVEEEDMEFDTYLVKCVEDKKVGQ